MFIFLSSPAKSFNFEREIDFNLDYSTPKFLQEADYLVSYLKTKTPKQLTKILQVSDKLAQLNYERFQDWDLKHTKTNSYLSVLAYFGDVFRQLEIDNFEKENFDYAKESLYIITGLYGLLNALDLIQPYRLEMKLSLTLKRKKTSLADFWKVKITEYLSQISKDKIILNLSSNEYTKAIDTDKLDSKFIQIDFKQKNKKGEYKNIGILSKKARGTFLNWAILNQVKSLDEIFNFHLDGYSLKEKEEGRLVFYQN
jgi:cytoplasmic iron level regulating protein YaaA (DUF328/UPF0246 family)